MTAEAGLRRLWQMAFGDTEGTLDAFFATCFSLDRHCSIWVEDTPASALYWLDCELQGYPLAYIYAAATDTAFRGQGYFRRLMDKTHDIMRKQGYGGVLLVPGSASLFALYKKLGYSTCTTVREFFCTQGDVPVGIREISAREYKSLRREFLPSGGVIQEGTTLDFLQKQGGFYAGEDFLLCAAREDDCLTAQELLGNAEAVPGILRALDIPSGYFRTPGAGREFAMFLPFSENCPIPEYFGLALD